MSDATHAAEQPAIAPEAATQEMAAAPDAVNAAVQAESNRPPIKAPESGSLTQGQTAVASPEGAAPKIPPLLTPAPPLQQVAVAGGDVANDSMQQLIEQNLSKFVGDRLPAGFADGLSVKVTLAKSNAVTKDPETKEVDPHDILISFIGGKFEGDEKHSALLSQLIRSAMREHPAFGDLGFGGADTQIDHEMRCQILSLESERLQHLLTEQPRKHTTFVEQPTPAHVLHVVPHGVAQGAHVAPAVADHASATPTQQVHAPVAHHGVAAANDHAAALQA